MNASSRSGVSAGWNWVSCGRSCCGPPIWSTTRSWWRRLVVLLDLQLGDDLEHVAGDPVLDRQAVGRDRGRLGRGALHQRSRRAPGPRGRVLEAVGVAVVAVERRGRRVELEDRLPEAVGELVDGRRCGSGRVTRWVSSAARRGRGARTGVPLLTRSLAPRPSGDVRSAPNSGICSRRALDRRVEPEVRLEVGEVERVRARGTPAGGSHLTMCQLPASIAARSSGERSSL